MVMKIRLRTFKLKWRRKRKVGNHFSVDADFCQGTSSSAIQREDNDPRLRSF